MRNNKHLRRLGLALIALVLIFGTMTVTARERSDVTVVEKAIATLLYPLQWATDYVAGHFRGLTQTVRELSDLRDENASLRDQVQQAEQLGARNEQLVQENQTLRNELNMKERAKYPLLTAQVISRTADNWYRTILINQGSRDGVQPNMAVVNWQGLVGKVSATTPYTATVQLVIDAGFGQTGFGAGAKVPTGELGVIETVQGGHVRMKFFSSEPAVQIGQPVFTSGQGVIPPDLLIGYVGGMGTGDTTFDKFVTVRPAVDFHKLDVVHVVLHPTDKDRGANAP
ncbi:MAG TPA: rod shape-determining protein MreC [Symbiobacteriaceae bacterium]|jgi:rod shape-determining protein MreC|nr:rod shape-determining protein MreC [Symbiobacteriaceae bacterium]